MAAVSALLAGTVVPTPAAGKPAGTSAMQGVKVPEGAAVSTGYHIGAPQGWTEKQGDKLVWREPRLGETHGISITVQEPKNERAIPGCTVSVWLTGGDGKDIGTSMSLVFMWAEDISRYTGNVSLPSALTSATLSARIEPPDYPRLGKQGGAFFPAGFTVSWPAVEIPPPVSPCEAMEAPPGHFMEGRHPRIEPTPYPGAGTLSADAFTTPPASAGKVPE